MVRLSMPGFFFLCRRFDVVRGGGRVTGDGYTLFPLKTPLHCADWIPGNPRFFFLCVLPHSDTQQSRGSISSFLTSFAHFFNQERQRPLPILLDDSAVLHASSQRDRDKVERKRTHGCGDF